MKKHLLILIILPLLLFSACSDAGSAESTTDKTAAQLMEVVMNTVQFPQMIDLNDNERIEEMGIDLTVTEDYAIKQQMISVDVCEVIIIKASSENMEKLLEVLNSRKDSLKNFFANYPEQLQSANATVVGSKKDIAYLICHTDAAKAEEQLLSQI